MQEMGFIKQNKTSNKNYPVGKKTGQLAMQDKTRQGRTGTGNIRQQTGTGLQTQGDYKGSKLGGK